VEVPGVPGGGPWGVHVHDVLTGCTISLGAAGVDVAVVVLGHLRADRRCRGIGAEELVEVVVQVLV
jgi:hypothetical protein